MEIYENTTIYIICPANAVSGGPELLHQLGAELLRRGLHAFMIYPDAKPDRPPQPEAYRKYHVPCAPAVEDEKQNILILSETATILFCDYNQIRKILWWLSVDHYFEKIVQHFKIPVPALVRTPIWEQIYLFHPVSGLEHWVQSEYARRFVQRNGIPGEQIHFVGDYLQTGTHLQSVCDTTGQGREDIVAYNPQKGFAFTKRLMDAAPDITWTPIEHMTAVEVHALLARAKCYIDFGTHPGQDRIPREAAMAGCCVITGKRGAAANGIDVPIPSAYKFDDASESIPAILACLRACLASYAAHARDFDSYRTMIAGQKAAFRRDVAAALPLAYDTPSRQHIVLQNGPHLETLLPALLENDALSVAGIWFPEHAHGFFRFHDHELSVLWTEELQFLHAEGRIDAILLDETDGKGAAALQAAGVPSSIFC